MKCSLYTQSHGICRWCFVLRLGSVQTPPRDRSCVGRWVRPTGLDTAPQRTCSDSDLARDKTRTDTTHDTRWGPAMPLARPFPCANAAAPRYDRPQTGRLRGCRDDSLGLTVSIGQIQSGEATRPQPFQVRWD